MQFETEDDARQHWQLYYFETEYTEDAFGDWLIDNCISITEELGEYYE